MKKLSCILGIHDWHVYRSQKVESVFAAGTATLSSIIGVLGGGFISLISLLKGNWTSLGVSIIVVLASLLIVTQCFRYDFREDATCLNCKRHWTRCTDYLKKNADDKEFRTLQIEAATEAFNNEHGTA